MKRDFTIRSYFQSDEDSLKEIIRISFPRFFRFFASRSLDSEGPVLVSLADKNVVGFAKLVEFKVGDNRFGCVLWLAVHSNFRGQHFATELVRTATEFLFEHRAKAVFASTQKRNLGSLATFNRAGFRQMRILDLWRIFSWRVFDFYMKIWYAPGEIVLMRERAEALSDMRSSK